MTHMDEAIIPHFRFFDCDSTRVDPDIADALENEFEYTMGPGFSFEFNMEEKEFYAVLSVIDSWNAPALIEMGMPTPESVVRFLQMHDLTHVIRDNLALTEKAKKLGVPVGVYIDIYATAHRMDNAYARTIKGLEKYAELKGKRYCRATLLPLMVSGTVSYEDAEVVGYEEIEENSNIPEVVSALITLNPVEDRLGERGLFAVDALKETREKRFTAADVHRALSEMEAFRASRMKLLVSFGAVSAFEIRNPFHVSKLCSREEIIGRDKVDERLALFIDAIITETTRVATETRVDTPELPSIYVLKRLHGAGVDPVFAAPHFVGNDWDENHIMALHDGVTQPLTDGWL